jgi:ornithine cyclodeaminase/alanine dehydrogenase-like protein (mu-crystallin family)
MQIRGLKDIATHGATVNRCVPRTGAQAAFQLGLLEQERSKLQREISVWLANSERAEARLRMIRERIGVLQEFLDASREHDSPGASPSRSAGPMKRRPKPRGHTVTLQY